MQCKDGCCVHVSSKYFFFFLFKIPPSCLHVSGHCSWSGDGACVALAVFARNAWRSRSAGGRGPPRRSVHLSAHLWSVSHLTSLQGELKSLPLHREDFEWVTMWVFIAYTFLLNIWTPFRSTEVKIHFLYTTSAGMLNSSYPEKTKWHKVDFLAELQSVEWSLSEFPVTFKTFRLPHLHYVPVCNGWET